MAKKVSGWNEGVGSSDRAHSRIGGLGFGLAAALGCGASWAGGNPATSPGWAGGAGAGATGAAGAGGGAGRGVKTLAGGLAGVRGAIWPGAGCAAARPQQANVTAAAPINPKDLVRAEKFIPPTRPIRLEGRRNFSISRPSLGFQSKRDGNRR